ncbi:MAG TPA: response regulator transcription factor [Candidatus Limnocylindrales bacterium]|nr:response regulator transcription factor [Candidatus Limnocylindrales bacterium]
MSPEAPLRILVIDDEPAMIGAVAALVGSVGHRVSAAYDGHEAMRRYDADLPDLVILDLAMPGLDGIAVCRAIRGRGSTPIIVLSGEAQEAAKVEALDAGADDYVTKPFGKEELLARIRAVSRRRTEPAAHGTGGRSLRIDRRRHEAWAGDTLLPLTPIEFALLETLLRAGGDLVTHEELLQAGWRGEPDPDPLWIKPHLARLRSKLRDADAALPTPVRSLGYRLIEPSPAAPPTTEPG